MSILDERRGSDGRRRLMLTEADRDALRQQQLVEGAVALFLDLTSSRSYSQIAEELGITVRQLRRLVETDEFARVYEEHFDALGHDPRLQAVKSGLMDLLPMAFDQLRKALIEPGVPWTTRMRAIEKIMEMNGVRPQDAGKSDRRELAEFLGKFGVNIGEMHIHGAPVPSSYSDALDEVMEGEVEEVTPLQRLTDGRGEQVDEPSAGDAVEHV